MNQGNERTTSMSKTKGLVQMAIFAALIVVLAFTPFIGYIPLGFTRATIIHIPVIMGSLMLGPKRGAALGGVFGLTSFINNTINPTLTSFVFTPFYSLGEYSGGIGSLIICFVPRILIGVAGASSSFLSSFSVLEARLFITFTKQKITSAIRRKLITAVIKLPYLIVSFSPDPIRITQLEKLTPPVRRLITGMIISFTREFTIDWNAPPIITPTARSITFPLAINSLNSAINPFLAISNPLLSFLLGFCGI